MLTLLRCYQLVIAVAESLLHFTTHVDLGCGGRRYGCRQISRSLRDGHGRGSRWDTRAEGSYPSPLLREGPTQLTLMVFLVVVERRNNPTEPLINELCHRRAPGWVMMAGGEADLGEIVGRYCTFPRRNR